MKISMKRMVGIFLSVLLVTEAWSSETEHLSSVRVTMEPAATLLLNHKVVSEGTSFQLVLPANKPALLEASAPGYVTAYRVVYPQPGERRLESFKLQRHPIPVLFRSNHAATVLCDGQVLGVTPFSTFFAEPKVYRVVFRAQGCADTVIRMDLANAKPRIVNAELASDSATLSVHSSPEGATVLINGVPRGVTPCTLPRLREGEHTLMLKLAGYHVYEQTVSVRSGDASQVSAILQKLPAGLTIVASQPESQVYVNGRPYGTAPLTLHNVTEGAYSIRVEKEGCQPIDRKITLTAGQTHEERFELLPLMGHMRIQTQPGTVEVWVDGRRTIETHPEKPEGFTSSEATIQLPIGKHSLVFKAEGYADSERVVEVKQTGNELLRVRLNFKPNFEVRTKTEVHRGVLVRQDADGSVSLELRPGMYRTFPAGEIRSKRFWSEKNVPVAH